MALTVSRSDVSSFGVNGECKNLFSRFILGVEKVPIQWERAPPYIREKYLDRHPEYRNYTTGAGSLHTDKINADQVLNFILGVSERTCQE